MKRVIILIILSITFIAYSLWAQSPDRMPHQQFTPEQMAGQKTNRLEKELSLDAKQSKKVYKLYLQQAKKLQSELSSHAGRMGGRPSFGGPPPGDGFGGRGGRPSHFEGDGNERPDMEKRGPRPSVYQESDEDRVAREKKMKKILSEDQYIKWMEIEEEMRKNERDRQQREELKRTFPELDLEQLDKEYQKDTN